MKRNVFFHRTLVAAGLPLLLLALLLTGRIRFAEAADGPTAETSVRILPVSEVKWTPLNPARGDASPQAGTLWGDRAGDPQTGFLVKFADGFSSPPHIHNVTYRGVVISGQIHNDDPDAEEMWMPAGSYWTQPAGEVHITAAQGADNMAFIEIEHGPYLVWPPEKASDTGERPINVHASNLVWLDADSTTWIEGQEDEHADQRPAIAFLWGQPEAGQPTGTLLTLPAGFAGELRSGGSSLKTVVIAGQPQVQLANGKTTERLDPGSPLQAEGAASFRIESSAEHETILYLRADEPYRLLAR